MTDGEWSHPVARHGPAAQFKSTAQIHARLFCGQWIIIPAGLSPRRASGFAFRRILRSRHDLAGDLSHVFSGIGELTSQELRLNLHGLLKVGGVNQSSRVLERRLHVLFGER